MAEESNARRFAIDCAKVMHPICPFSPDCFSLISLAVEGMPKHFFYAILWTGFEAKIGMGTDGKHTIFKRVNLDRSIGGMKMEFEVNGAGGGITEKG